MNRSWGFVLKLLSLLIIVLLIPSFIKGTWDTTINLMDYLWEWSNEWAMKYFGKVLEEARNFTITIPTG